MTLLQQVHPDHTMTTENQDTKAASVATRGAKAITDEDLGLESERTENGTEVDLQEDQVGIETKIATGIARGIAEKIEAVRVLVGENTTGAEVAIYTVARKVCIIEYLNRHVRDANKVQSMLHHERTTLAADHDHDHVLQFATAQAQLHVPDLLHGGRARSVTDRHPASTAMMQISMRKAQTQSSLNQRLCATPLKRPRMATKTVRQMKMMKMLCSRR